jgi:Domain of Unknown Function (DUF928)
MTKHKIKGLIITSLPSVAGAAVLAAAMPSVAQNQTPAPTQEQAASEPKYKPPPRGAPGGRVGGASRGTVKTTVPLPTVELLAPDGHAGLTTSATPTLYFFVSQPVSWPTQLTISAPARPNPLVEVNIPAPRRAGVYTLRTADYHVRLEPGVLYTWSVSVILNPEARSRDIVASASLLRTAPDPTMESALLGMSASGRAVLLAQAGLWYDAVAAAGDIEAFDRHAALDALMNEVGLVEAARYDRQATSGDRSR